jgi:hypothetical protein
LPPFLLSTLRSVPPRPFPPSISGGRPCPPCKFLQAFDRGIICFFFHHATPRCTATDNTFCDRFAPSIFFSTTNSLPRPTTEPQLSPCATTLPDPASWHQHPPATMAPHSLDTYFDDEEDSWYGNPQFPLHRIRSGSFSRLTPRAAAPSASRSSISPTETSDHALVAIRCVVERSHWPSAAPLTASTDMPVLLQQYSDKHERPLPSMPPPVRRQDYPVESCHARGVS